MKYRFEHEFACDRDMLIRTMFEKGVATRLLTNMKAVEQAEELSWEERGSRVVRRVRYLPVPMIKSIGPKKVEPRWMEWVEESEVDLATGAATYRNVPTTGKVAELLKNFGTIQFVSAGPGRSKRILEGELKVLVFLVGAVAERVIHGHAKTLVDEEARALQTYVESLKA